MNNKAKITTKTQKKPRGGSGLKALAQTVDRLTRPLIRKRGFADGTIIHNWDDIVGPALARHSAPEKLVFPMGAKINGTLQLRVENGSFAMELQHLEPILLEKINAYFGFKAVSGIRIIQAPLPETKSPFANNRPPLDSESEQNLQQSLDTLTDPDLRNILERLGRSVFSANKK